MRDEWAGLEREASRRTRLMVLVAVLAATAFFGWVRLYAPEAESETAAAAPEPVELPSTVVEVPPEPVAGVSGSTAPGRETQVGIYECTQGGQRVLSDRPCGPDAEVRTLTVSQPDPRDAYAAQQRSRAVPSTVTRDRSADSPDPAAVSPAPEDAEFAREARCTAIDRAIEGINARMRQGGYGTDEGNRLRGRWHKLKDEWYELKCRKTGVD